MANYNNILNFYEEYIKIEQVIRKGWLMREVPSPRLESVGDHTLQLMMLASVITKELGIEVDLKKLMEMLLIHDIGEAIIGDISDVEKDANIKKLKEREAVKNILSNLNDTNANYYYQLWLEMDNKETELAKFAYSLDKIDAVIKAGIYEKEYNLNGLFDEFYSFQVQRGTFNNNVLEEFFIFLKDRFDKKIVK